MSAECNKMQITVQGSLDPPRVAGLAADEASLLRIACAQVLPSKDSERGDLDKLAAYSKEAAAHGADGGWKAATVCLIKRKGSSIFSSAVIVFPEYFLSGATHDAWRAVQEQKNANQTTSERYLKHVAEVATQNNIDIVAGTIVERGGDHVPHRSEEQNDQNEDGDDGHDSKVFNTVYYIDRTGRTAGRYTKRRLWHPERSVLSAGHELRHKAPRCFPIKTRNGKELLASIAVCVSARDTKACSERDSRYSAHALHLDSGIWHSPKHFAK